MKIVLLKIKCLMLLNKSNINDMDGCIFGNNKKN